MFCLITLPTSYSEACDEQTSGGQASARVAAEAEAQDAHVQQLVTRSQVEAAMDLPCPAIMIHRDAALSTVLALLEEHMIKTSGVSLAVVPDTAELELESISSLEDVTIPGLLLQAGTHTCRDVLEILWSRTTDPALTAVPMPGHLIVTTKAKAEEMLESRIYDLGDLLILSQKRSENSTAVDPFKSSDDSKKKRRRRKASVARGSSESQPMIMTKQLGGGGLGGSGAADLGSPASMRLSAMLDLIQEQTSPPAKWLEVDGEGGTISVYGQYAMIRQTYATH